MEGNMSTIDFQFSKKQVEYLVYSLFVGAWVTDHELSTEKTEYKTEIEKLEQHVLGVAFNAKYFDWIEYDDNYGMYFVSQSKEEELIKQIIDTHNQDNFWIELEDQLSLRDIVKKYGKEKVENMDLEELAKERFEIMDQYTDEFEKHGIDRFYLKK